MHQEQIHNQPPDQPPVEPSGQTITAEPVSAPCHPPVSENAAPATATVEPAILQTVTIAAETAPEEAVTNPGNEACLASPGLEAQLREAQQQAGEHHEAWLRAKAEGENIRRRAQEDIAKAHKFAVERFAGDLLAVKDSLEAALTNQNQSVESFQAGVDLTLKQLVAAFDKSGLKEINPLGAKFDPHFHQAIGMVESDHEANTVVTVLQKGYLIAERVLRPALVMVAKARPVAPTPNTPPAPEASRSAANPPPAEASSA